MKKFWAVIFLSLALILFAWPALALSTEDNTPTNTPSSIEAEPLDTQTPIKYQANDSLLDTTDKITRFDSSIFITQAGTAQITETITYSNNATHHGLERFVPIWLFEKTGNQNYFFNFKLISVQDLHGKDYKVSRHDSMSAVGLRIGDPNSTFSGEATYVIKYELSPVVSQQSGFDFLNLNITGNDWRIPIISTHARIAFENNLRASNVKCFVGTVGSTDQACAIKLSDGEYEFTSLRPIKAGEGMTVNAQLSEGSFANYIKTSQIPPFWWLWQWVIGWVVGGIILCVAFIIRFIKQILFWRDKKSQTVIAEYEPPDGLKPAEIGLLNDNISGMAEITATLIDLAVRKYIRIDQVRPKQLFREPKYNLVQLNQARSGLEDYELLLLDAIFTGASQNEHKQPTIELAKLNKLKMQQATDSIKSLVNSRLEAKDFYPNHSKNKASFVKQIWQKSTMIKIISPIIIITLVAVIYIIFISSGQVAPFIATGVALALAYFISNFRRPTASGVKEWAKIEGFKWFLNVTEKDRLKFTDAPDKNPKLFSKLLPYAVALGVEKEWAKQFEGMDMKSEMYWYGSPDGAFSPTLFANNISTVTSQFSSSVSSGFTASSRGGGAGGGAGGGGGGGW